jgi:hypothetical protein
MSDWHPDEEVLIDLALSDVDERQRDDLTRHLAECALCRAEYASIADAVDHVLAAAPHVDPPAGFSQSALIAMGIGERAGELTGFLRRLARGGRPRVALAVAAAVAFGLVVGAAGSVAVLQDRGQAGEVLVAAGTPLLNSEGVAVGSVQESRHDGQPVLVVTVIDGEAGASYACHLVLADGTREPAGSWALDDVGGGTWVITQPDDAQVVRVEMVTDTGAPWATATI